jgi:signal transduction histidine kinase/DNA-binding response OmpR family regulator/CHASE3 domain sensor protein
MAMDYKADTEKNFERNLVMAYGVSLLLLLISAVASTFSIYHLLESSRLVNHTNEIIKELRAVLSYTKDGEAGQRGYLLTGDDIFLNHYTGSKDKAVQSINRVREMTTDHAEQQRSTITLMDLVSRRFHVLQRVINQRRETDTVPMQEFEEGRMIMEDLRSLITTMETREQTLLESRTARQNRFAAYTPILIILASLLGVLVTVISFMRVLSDFRKRKELHIELERKNAEITERIQVIERVSTNIANGQFETRVSGDEQVVLGELATSLNKMASSLQFSFGNLADKEWIQAGIAQLNEKMIGEKELEPLTYKIIEFLSSYTNSPVAAFYLVTDPDTLTLRSSIAIQQSRLPKDIHLGDGLAGQAALSRKTVLIEHPETPELYIDYSAGGIKPKTIIAIPVFYEGALKGVIELASLSGYTKVAQEMLREAAFNIGTALHTAKDHQRLQELLSETQAQSLELQAQHAELENVNDELEMQAEKLQASEEELKVQQEELQQANQELEERSRLLEEKNEAILERNLEIQHKVEELAMSTKYKSEFLANMSHELRTPLNSILLLSRLLYENHGANLSKEQIEYAEVIQSSGKGLLTLIDEILDLSKIESGKMSVEYGDVSLEELVNALNTMFVPMAVEKGIRFKAAIRPGTPAILHSDHQKVEQILRNLISNALKFTKAGSVAVEVSARNNAIAFEVLDTGIGIPKDKQQTIFEAFQQADGSTRRQYGGTGLGLSISRELARLLGGEIQLQSEEGKGSAFTLLLPLQKEEPMNTPPFEMTLPAVTSVKAVEPSYLSDVIPASIPDDRDTIEHGDKVILIVEDDIAFAKSLLDYTRNNGFKGIVAVRGDEAITLASDYMPFGILLDLQLPVKSGWEVMDALKSNAQTKHIPVHMMSSHEVMNQSLVKGAVDFINKPVAFEKLGEMFKKIEDALSRHPKKVLIVEENPKHAKALAYFLENYEVNAAIKTNVDEGISELKKQNIDCVILDMGVPAHNSYELLEEIKKTPGFEHLPIIVFTGKNLSHTEEVRIRQYADSIVLKTAHSYQRILDEVSLFLHLVEANKQGGKTPRYRKLGELAEVLKGKTVLVADDDVRNIFSLTKSLEQYGMQVISAVDGKDALKQLEEHGKVDLVLMDMMMPEMDGYESTRRIRAVPKYRNLPIIAVTAKAMTGDREKCIKAGASDYITKPVDVDQLLSLLRVWLYE